MRKTIACILTIIYFSFTAGAVWHVQLDDSDIVSIETSYGDSTNASDKATRNPSFHIEIVNFHKAHKHLAASRTPQVQRLSFANLSPANYTSPIKTAFIKIVAIASVPPLFQAPIFIKNCVLRI